MTSLQGKTILVTREASQAGKLMDEIERAEGKAVHIPLLSFQIRDSDENREILTSIRDFTWVFVTSANGVKFFFELLEKYAVQLPEHIRFAIIGTKTQAALEKHGCGADFVPTSFRAGVMKHEFIAEYPDPGPILYINGNRSRRELPEFFATKGLFFKTVTAYDTLLMKEEKNRITSMIRGKEMDALTFASPSAISAFAEMVPDGAGIPCFCIGPTTAKQAKEYGFKQVHFPETYTVEHMVRQMIAYFSKEGNR